MALPNSIDASTPGGTDSPALGDDQFRALKTFIEDVFGVPDATSITAAAFSITAGGVVTVSQSGMAATSPVFTTQISTPSIVTASGALGITPAAGSNLNIALSTTGDLVINTNQLYVDTSNGNVGFGTAVPVQNLHVVGNAGTLPAAASTLKGILIEDTVTTRLTMISNTTGTAFIHFGDADNVDRAHISYDHTNDFIEFASAGVADAFVIKGGAGVIGVGTSSTPTGGGPAIALAQGTQPTGIGANTAGNWVQDVAGTAELMGFDEAGNDVQLTPHPSDFLNSRAKSTVAWGYSWSNRYEGKRYIVDMGRVIDLLLAAYPLETFLKVEGLPPEKRADWDTDQEARFQQRLKAQMAWDANTYEQKGIRPPDFQKKRPPKWLVDRGVKTAIRDL